MNLIYIFIIEEYFYTVQLQISWTLTFPGEATGKNKHVGLTTAVISASVYMAMSILRKIDQMNLTGEARVQFLVRVYWIFGAKSGYGTGFPSSVFSFPSQFSFHQCSILSSEKGVIGPLAATIFWPHHINTNNWPN
jgi:hypothetical protein